MATTLQGDGALQKEACKNGLGVSILLCVSADLDPELIRVPPYTSEGKYDLWVLSHPALRKNAKVQLFVRHMTDYVLSKKELIEGRSM